MTDVLLRQLAARFDPARARDWTCVSHRGTCPADTPRWRAVHAELVEALADLSAPGAAEDFTTWLARSTAGCRPVDHRAAAAIDPAAIRAATERAAESSRRWLADHPEETDHA